MNPRAFIEAHFQAVIEGRVEDVIAAYAKDASTYVFVEGPRWSTLGHAKIEAGWRAYLAAPFRLTSSSWLEGPFEAEADGMGFVAGILELGVRRGVEERLVRFRASFVLRREAGGLRIVHEHLSQPAADPYGTGDWLKEA